MLHLIKLILIFKIEVKKFSQLNKISKNMLVTCFYSSYTYLRETYNLRNRLNYKNLI